MTDLLFISFAHVSLLSYDTRRKKGKKTMMSSPCPLVAYPQQSEGIGSKVSAATAHRDVCLPSRPHPRTDGQERDRNQRCRNILRKRDTCSRCNQKLAWWKSHPRWWICENLATHTVPSICRSSSTALASSSRIHIVQIATRRGTVLRHPSHPRKGVPSCLLRPYSSVFAMF